MMPEPARQRQSRLPELRSLLAALPVQSPREIFRRLEELGYRGQEAARRSASVFAYRHVRRLQRIYCEGISRSQLPPKSNLLLIGPTGCGKTYLVELLFGEVFPLPHAVFDVTRVTESGYVGQDVSCILTRLLVSAGGDPLAAQIGVVAIDEIDKIALQSSSARFAGAETTKDVKGNVQKELLQIVAGGKVSVPAIETESHIAPRILLDTRDIGFVGTGAFSGIKELAVRQRGGGFGFHATAKEPEDTLAYDLNDDDVLSVELFQSYGFLPEFIARFGQICRLQPLGRRELRRILMDNVLPPLQHEFALEGLNLQLKKCDRERFLDEALERRIGARGLRTAVERFVEMTAFERFGANT